MLGNRLVGRLAGERDRRLFGYGVHAHGTQIRKMIGVIVVRGGGQADGDGPVGVRNNLRNERGRVGIVRRVEGGVTGILAGNRVARFPIITGAQARGKKGEAIRPRGIQAGQLEAGKNIAEPVERFGVAEERVARGIGGKDRRSCRAAGVRSVKGADHDQPRICGQIQSGYEIGDLAGRRAAHRAADIVPMIERISRGGPVSRREGV